MSVYVLNAQTRSPDRPSLKYSSGGSGPLIKKDEAFCLATSNGGGAIHTMRYFSMFSGIGGFEKGIEDAFANMAQLQQNENRSKDISPDTLHEHGKTSTGVNAAGVCIGFSEIYKNAINIYLKHYPGHHNYGSATDINAAELPDFDLLVGGFPCQAFSIAGKRLGFDDTRGTLFFEIARILREKRPGRFLLENVKGLLSHDNGNTFKTIISTLVELGYCVEWQVLNSKNYGVPQNRERVFIHGFREGCGRQVFPIGSIDHQTDGVIKEESKKILRGRPEMPYKHGERKLRYEEYSDVCPTLTTSPGHGDQVNLVKEQIKATQGLSDAQRVREIDGQSSTLKGLGGGQGAKTGLYAIPEFDGYRIRRLTPVECERLQGFTDDWTKYGADGKTMSDSARYKACGNAVTTNVIRAIMEAMYE